MAETKMIYGMEMNIHQVDQYTIQMYVLNVKEGSKPHAPVTVEHPDKHPDRVKGNGEPYAREHASLFNILKTQLVKEGKWKTVCSGCGWIETDRQKPIVEDGQKYCPVCDGKVEA